MINIFQVAPNDQSIYFLGQIFGNVGVALAGNGPALLGAMFKVFNTGLLAIGALLVAYTTVVGVLRTAHEGEFLGKNSSGLWVPLRTVGGIVALFPTKSGYCALQVLMMWFIVQGIGAADMVWKAATDYLNKGGAIVTVPPSAAVTSTVPSIMQEIFANAVCQSIVTKLTNNDADIVAHSTPFTNSSDPNNIVQGVNFGSPSNNSECGYVTWGILPSSDPDSVPIRSAQSQAFSTMVPVIEALANHYVNAIISDQNCWSTYTSAGDCTQQKPITCKYFKKYQTYLGGGGGGTQPASTTSNTSGGAPNPTMCLANVTSTGWSQVQSYAGSNFMSDAILLMNGYINNYITQKAPPAQPTNQNVNGWIFAGAYYFNIAKTNSSGSGNAKKFVGAINVNKSKGVQDLSSAFNSSPPASPDFAYNTWPNYTVSSMYCGQYKSQAQPCTGYSAGDPSATKSGGAIGVGAQAYLDMLNAQNTGGGIAGTAGKISHLPYGFADSPVPGLDLLAIAATALANSFIDALGGVSSANPLVQMQSFGQGILDAADNLFYGLLVAAVVLGLASTQIEGLGTTLNYAAGISGAALVVVLSLGGALVSYMYSIGAILGVYTPMLPYILFAFGAIGWFIATIEAMVAAPVVALGLLIPGQSEIFGRAEPALMIALSVFLRPTLMIFGMLAGLLLSYIVVNYINATFFYAVSSMFSGGVGMGIVEAFLFLMAYAGLIITALNKCFSLIHVIPERTLRYLGHHGEQHGEAEAAEAVKGKVQSGAQAAGQGAQSAAGSATKSNEKMEAAATRRKENAKPGGPNVSQTKSE